MDLRKVTRWNIALLVLLIGLASAALLKQQDASAGQETRYQLLPGQPERFQLTAPQTNIKQASVQPTSLQAGSTFTQSISISPAAFIRDLTAPEISMTNDLALRWQANNTEQAGLYLKRPADWADQTPVKIHLYFALGGSSAGAVNWRLKLNTYTPGSGEWLTNPGTRDADAILNFPDGPSWYRIYSQTFTIAAADFHDEPLWSFFFLRGSGVNGETFTGDLYVMLAEVEYQARSPISGVFLPLVSK